MRAGNVAALPAEEALDADECDAPRRSLMQCPAWIFTQGLSVAWKRGEKT